MASRAHSLLPTRFLQVGIHFPYGAHGLMHMVAPLDPRIDRFEDRATRRMAHELFQEHDRATSRR